MRMHQKRTHALSIRFDDEIAKHIREYAQWFQQHGPGIEVSSSDAARSLMERGYAAWRHEQKRQDVKRRKVVS